MGRIKWGASSDRHLRGLPRRLTILSVGAFAKVVTSVLNTCTVRNAETLVRLIRSRPTGTPLITVSNHMSTLDDPLIWGAKGFLPADTTSARWVLSAEDICFRNAALSYFFLLGKCLPVARGGGIYQDHMNKALDILNKGYWLHTFPEGKISQEHGPIRRLKWGTASLIARANLCPIVLPIVHSGFEKVMPEKSFLGRRPPIPLCGNHIRIVVGEPMQFDLKKLRQVAISESRQLSFQPFGWPDTDLDGLDEAAQRWLYIRISNEIQSKMEMLRGICSTMRGTPT